MNWRTCGWCAAAIAVVVLGFLWTMKQGADIVGEEDVVVDSLLATHVRVLQQALDSLHKTAHERDSVLRLSDARGDTMKTLRRFSDMLGDSLEKVIGKTPTYTFDSAACNVALRLALRQRDIIAQERDKCQTDRASLRQQLVRDSTEHRQQVARLIFRLDSTDKALVWERTKPRPCRVEFNFVLAKPTMSCGAAMGSSAGLGLLFGLLVK